MPLATPNSPNVSQFDYSADFALASRTLTIEDASIYIEPDGADNISAAGGGLFFKVTAPNGTTLYDTSDFPVTPSILPNAPLPLEILLPLFAGEVVWGTYTIIGYLKDADATIYTLTKTVKLCDPCTCGCTASSDGCAEISTFVNCSNSLLEVSDTTNYTYNGISTTDIAYNITITYPASSGVGQIPYGAPYFTIPVYTGTYVFDVSNVATYSYGDLVTVDVTYTKQFNKFADCNLDLCWLHCGLRDLTNEYLPLIGTGSVREKQIEQKLRKIALYIHLIESGNSCGYDVSAYIQASKDILGGDCACVCGTRSVNRGINLPSTVTFVFNKSCADADVNFETNIVGNTVYVDYEDVHYEFVVVESAQAGFQVTQDLTGCVKTLTFDIVVDELLIGNDYTVPDIALSDPTYDAPTSNDQPVSTGASLGTLVSTILTALANIISWAQAAGTQLASLTTRVTALETVSWTGLAWNGSSVIQNPSAQAPQYTIDPAGWVTIRGYGKIAGGAYGFISNIFDSNLPAEILPAANFVATASIATIAAPAPQLSLAVSTTGVVALAANSVQANSANGDIFYVNLRYNVNA